MDASPLLRRALLSFLLSAPLAGAAAARAAEGLYVGLEMGLAQADELALSTLGVNHPTRCDVLLYPPGTAPAAEPACQDMQRRPLFSNVFDGDGRSAAAVALGRGFGRWRLEAEYLARHQGGDRRSFQAAGGNAALTGKDTEWAVAPEERLSGFRARQLFANLYYDFPSASRWTPYAGFGAGWASTRLGYEADFVRKPEAAYLAIDFDPDWPEAAKRAAAGTVSAVGAELDDDLFGWQLLLGADYELSERVAVSVKARRAWFEELAGERVWRLIRSHAPVLADGSTPFRTTMEFSDIGYWSLTAGLKVRF